MVTFVDVIPPLKGIVVCTYIIASLHPLFLSPNLPLVVHVCASCFSQRSGLLECLA
jgi:hypothetical protein